MALKRSDLFAIATLLLFGCASSGRHKIGVDVFETVTAEHAVGLFGEHLLRVQIENGSKHDFMLHSIHVEPVQDDSLGPDLFTDDPSVQIEQVIGVGDSRSFDITLNVSTSGRNPNMTTGHKLGSVTVMLSCTDSDGANFTDSGTYWVHHVRSGD